MITSITKREPMRLTDDNVNHIFNECISTKAELSENEIIVSGVRLRQPFDIDRINDHRADIIDMLNQLPDTFHVGSGDGWTFLNMCIDNHGAQWTGLHLTCDKLLCLGMAIGACQFTIKQPDLWRMFPGGMPYITININRL